MMLLLALSGTAFAPINHGGAVEVLDVLEKWAEIPPMPDSRRMLQSRDLAAAKAKADRAAFVVVDITIQDNCEKAWQTFSEAPLAGRVKTARALSSSVHLSVSRLQYVIEQADSKSIRSQIETFVTSKRLATAMIASASAFIEYLETTAVRPDNIWSGYYEWRAQHSTNKPQTDSLSEDDFLEFCYHLPAVAAIPERAHASEGRRPTLPKEQHVCEPWPSPCTDYGCGTVPDAFNGGGGWMYDEKSGEWAICEMCYCCPGQRDADCTDFSPDTFSRCWDTTTCEYF